eukprot:3068804-Pleurochrysis_carterae.AAC.2
MALQAILIMVTTEICLERPSGLARNGYRLLNHIGVKGGCQGIAGGRGKAETLMNVSCLLGYHQ